MRKPLSPYERGYERGHVAGQDVIRNRRGKHDRSVPPGVVLTRMIESEQRRNDPEQLGYVCGFSDGIEYGRLAESIDSWFNTNLSGYDNPTTAED